MARGLRAGGKRAKAGAVRGVMTEEYRVPRGAGAASTTAFWHRVLAWRVALGVILLLAVLVRLPFLHVPLIADEGGYAYTTHYGLSGKTLYHLLWFDRTQGILWVYRVIFQTLGRSLLRSKPWLSP